MTYRFLALGDSYTIGEGVQAAQSWPRQLARALKAQGQALAPPDVIAQTGWTTRDLLDAVDASGRQGPFDLVTLAIGVNNQYQGEVGDSFRAEFSRLLVLAAGFAGGDPGRVLVLSIPDWSVTPFAAGRARDQIRDEIECFNRINREISQAAGVHYLDITPLSRQVRDAPGLLAADELHFSGQMYARWVDLMLPLVLGILRKPVTPLGSRS